MTTPDHCYTDRAATAILDAARGEHDFGGWLAQVLATAAAELGSTAALTAGRLEADLVQQLVRGTVGWTTTTSPTTPRSPAMNRAEPPNPQFQVIGLLRRLAWEDDENARAAADAGLAPA